MIQILTWGAFSLGCLNLGGCLELVRRHPAPGVDPNSAFPSVQESENGPESDNDRDEGEAALTAAGDTSGSAVVEEPGAAEDTLKISKPTAKVETVEEDPIYSASVQQAMETAASETPSGETAAGEAPLYEGNAEDIQVAKELSAPGVALARRESALAKVTEIKRTKRSRNRQQEVRQINEYAFWCVEKGLWNEARLHLEQAVERDSLAASLHNNLGIIYERLGLEEKAMAAYGKAWNLSPKEKAYRNNLELFERGRRALPDSAVQIDIIELDAQPELSPASGSAAEAQQSIYAGG